MSRAAVRTVENFQQSNNEGHMGTDKPLSIIDLRISNVMRVKAAHIHPDGKNVVLSGRNGQGKTSVLRSIDVALRGEKAAPAVPLRQGAEKGEVVLDLGEIVVRRTYAKGENGVVSQLVVTNKDGARFPSPQTMLDKMLGERSFDPLAFSRMDAGEQATTLKRLLRLDFTALDAERTTKFSERTGVNRDGKAMASRFDAMPSHPDAPEAEQSSAAILAEQGEATARHEKALAAANAANRANDAKRREAADAASLADRIAYDVSRSAANVEAAEAEVAEAQKRLADAKATASDFATRATAAREKAAALKAVAAALLDVGCVAPDLATFRTRLAAVEATNAKVRANKARAEAEAALNAKRAESKRLTERIDAIDAEKAALIAGAKFPVDGLGFGEHGVTFGGLPFDQASQAQQLRVSVAIGFALNPRIKVLLVKDASLLDAESLAMVEAMAVEAGGQVVLERVETDAATTVTIEDGTAFEVEPAHVG